MLINSFSQFSNKYTSSFFNIFSLFILISLSFTFISLYKFKNNLLLENHPLLSTIKQYNQSIDNLNIQLQSYQKDNNILNNKLAVIQIENLNIRRKSLQLQNESKSFNTTINKLYEQIKSLTQYQQEFQLKLTHHKDILSSLI